VVARGDVHPPDLIEVIRPDLANLRPGAHADTEGNRMVIAE
jgi:hypothetical protein